MKELLGAHNWLIAFHVNPDGDCIGSALAAEKLVEQLGGKAQLICADPIPPQYRFLEGTERVVREVPSGTWSLLCVDCSDLGRTGELGPKVENLHPIVNIDHHVSNRQFGDYNLVEPKASTGEIIAKLFFDWNLDIHPVAEALYVAIATDTGNFRYSSTDAETHRTAARLIEAGVKVGEVSNKLYDNVPLSTLKLQTMALSKMVIQKNVALTMVTRKMLEESQAKDHETDGIVERLRAIQGIEVAIFLRETERGDVKASLRSKDEIDVNKIAARFGGGGHFHAAGCTFNEPIEKAAKLLLDAFS